MSKQPHDQDEQQAPSAGTRNGGVGASGSEAGRGGSAAGRRRSRRYDKAGGQGQHQGQGNGRQQGGGAVTAGSAATQGGRPEAAVSAPAGQGVARPEAAAPEPVRSPSAGAEATKPDSTKPGPAKPEAAKPEATKPDSTKPEPAKPEAAKPEATKPEATKPDAVKSEPTKPAAASGGAAGGGASVTAGGRDGGDGKGGKAGLVALALVVLLALIGLLFGWQAWQKLDTQQQRLADLEAQGAGAARASELADLERRLDEGERAREEALSGAIDELQSGFVDYRRELDEALDRVLAELASEQVTDERDWLHAEAAYLLRLANQRLQLERDVQGAAALLRTADERLREADNPALVPVRREIAGELAALDAVPQVDRTGLWLSLNALQTQIAGQPLSQEVEEIVARSGIEEAPTGTWRQQLSRFGEELRELVTIRHHDTALEALITPEQETYLRQSVRLVIEQAQLALLKEEQELYEASIDKALTLINGYYDTGASGVRSVVSRLEALKGEAIRPELPDISGSQQALAGFIERRFESRGATSANGDRGDDA